MEESIYEVPHVDKVPHIVEGKYLETLIVAFNTNIEVQQ